MNHTRKVSILATTLCITALVSGIAIGSKLWTSELPYTIKAEVHASMKTPLDLGTLDSPANGSLYFTDAIVIEASTSGYITLTFTLTGDLTAIANHFNRFTVHICNHGGTYVTLDLDHLEGMYQLAVPQQWLVDVQVEYETRPLVNASGVVYLNLEIT